jgi:hypothetical protein
MPTVEEDMTMPEHAPKPKNEVVNAFREEIDRWFARYQSRYDDANASMRRYRLRHVELVSEIYNGIMTVMGDRIEEVRQAAYELDDLIDGKREELGRINECLQGIINTRNSNSASVGTSIQRCALIANQTLAANLNNIFYPTFARIQEEASIIPISVIDVLARGNVLEDEQEVLTFLEERYNALERQWFTSVSVLLTWETNRFRNEGLFLRSDMEICMGDATWEYLLVNSRLEGEVQEC